MQKQTKKNQQPSPLNTYNPAFCSYKQHMLLEMEEMGVAVGIWIKIDRLKFLVYSNVSKLIVKDQKRCVYQL